MRILIFGLPGSGKSTLAEKLSKQYNLTWYNADKVRDEYNDWDFSEEGRLRQANRMLDFSKRDNVVIDFVCPYKDIRNQFTVDYKIWMNTIASGRFEDTNKVFQNPVDEDCIEITSWTQTDNLEKIIL